MSNTYTNLNYHIIFSTKARLPLIKDHIKNELYSYISGIIKGEQAKILAIGGRPDHIHLLIKTKSNASLSNIVKKIKASSSKWMNDNCKSKFQWQRGYGAFSVSESVLDKVKLYIHEQDFHHQKKTFKDEFLGFIKKQNIEYDERYLFG